MLYYDRLRCLSEPYCVLSVREDGSRFIGSINREAFHPWIERDGFYGSGSLQGWDIQRLTERDVRQHLPPEGLWTELVVGLIQSEKLSPEPLTAAEFNDMLSREMSEFGL